MCRQCRKAFTLIELVIVLTIIAVILSVAFPAMTALNEEKLAREPIDELVAMVRDLRQRAVHEKRPYQIIFESEGFHGMRYFYPYEEDIPFKEYLVREKEKDQNRRMEIARMKISRSGVNYSSEDVETPFEAEEEVPERIPVMFHENYLFADGWSIEYKSWGDHEWQIPDSQKIKRWVFQPTGLSDPMVIRFRNGSMVYEMRFLDPLTAELTGMRQYDEQ